MKSVIFEKKEFYNIKRSVQVSFFRMHHQEIKMQRAANIREIFEDIRRAPNSIPCHISLSVPSPKNKKKSVILQELFRKP